MNKKGFTLIEIIVSIGLLALIGVSIGFSINNILKKQDNDKVESFDKLIKSAANLYVSNRIDILNELETNKAYYMIDASDLINNGYMSNKTVDPSTGNRVDEQKKIKVYYSKDKELVIEHENISSALELVAYNYTTTYGSADTNLCKKNINSDVYLRNGADNNSNEKINIVSENLNVYMEDGSVCEDSKLNTSKVGTYRLKYIYNYEGRELAATRTVTVKGSKPVINKFTVNMQENQSNIYKAKIHAEVSDFNYVVSNVPSSISYCLTYKNDINDCNNRWISDSSISNVNGKILIEKIIDIENDAYFKIKKDEPSIEIFIFVKNFFEEYDIVQMKNDDGLTMYLITSTIVFHLNTNNPNEKIWTDINKTNEIEDGEKIERIQNMPTRTNFSTILSQNSKFKKPIRAKYNFINWNTMENGQGDNYNNDTEVYGYIHLYAQWEEDITPPTCTITAESPLTVTKTGNDIASGVWTERRATLSIGTHTFTVKDYALNESSCSIAIGSAYSYTRTESCGYSMSCESGPGGWKDSTTCQWYENFCDRTYYACRDSGYTIINESFCYKY